MILLAATFLYIFLVFGWAQELDEEYYELQIHEEDSFDEYPDHVDTEDEDEDSSGTSERHQYVWKVVKECFPSGGGGEPPPPPTEPDLYRRERPQRVQKSPQSAKKQKSAAMIRPIASCKEFEETLVKETQALLIKAGKPCKNSNNPANCRWRYMTMARKMVQDPNETCLMQMMELYKN